MKYSSKSYIMAFFKLTSKQTGLLTAFFELEVIGDEELDYLNSFKEYSSVRQISMAEYEMLYREERDKCFFFDARV